MKLLYKTTDDISNKLLCKSRILSAPRRKKIQSLGLVRTAVKMSSLLIIQILNHSAPYRQKGCTVHTSHGVKCLSFQSFRLKLQAWERLEHLCVLLMNIWHSLLTIDFQIPIMKMFFFYFPAKRQKANSCFVLPLFLPFVYTDIDECVTRTHNCGVTMECRNTEGSFRCVPKQQQRCYTGFTQDTHGNCIGESWTAHRQSAR